jgi:hypothetical protein
MSDETTRTVSLSDLPGLRLRTETISRYLQEQIVSHLETLRPLFAPERVLGKYAGGKTDVPGMEGAMAELRQKYKPFAAKPYDLPMELDGSWLPLVGSSLDLYPWDYPHSIHGKSITLTSPVRWALNFRNNYNLAQVRNVLAGKESARPEYLRQFCVNALVLQTVLARNPGLPRLFADLRYELRTETPPEFKGLPVVTVTSCLTSFRPPDDLILAATAFSGIPAFIELLDLHAISSPRDALKEKLDELLKPQG